MRERVRVFRLLRLAERPQGTRKRWRGSHRRNEGRGTRGRKRSRKWKVKRGRSEVEVAVAVAVNAVEVAGRSQSRAGSLSVLYGVDCLSPVATTAGLYILRWPYRV